MIWTLAPSSASVQSRLVQPIRIVGDDSVRQRQNALGGAVVLLESNHDRFGVVSFKVEDVGDICATEGIDRLIVIPDDGEVAVLLRQQAQELVLRPVRVLVFVNENVAESAMILLEHLRVLGVQLHGSPNEVVEVQGVCRLQRLFVLAPDLDDRVADVSSALLHHRIWREHSVLVAIDLAADFTRHHAGGIVPLVLDDALDHSKLVIVVVDRESLGPSEGLDLHAQNSGTGGVEGAHPHSLRRITDQLTDSLTHLCRGLVGERDRKDLVGIDTGVKQVGDTTRQDPGFPRSCPRQNQEGPVHGGHGTGLLRVQALEMGRFFSHPSSSGLVDGSVREAAWPFLQGHVPRRVPQPAHRREVNA